MHTETITAAIEEANLTTFRSLPLSVINPSLTNPRKSFDVEELQSLADSIREHGVLQPIIVREHVGDGFSCYEIVAGERRFRAAQLAGLEFIPARIEELSNDQVLSIQLVENLQRADVHPLDEAEGLKVLIDVVKAQKGVSEIPLDEIASRIGKDVRYVARRLALTDLIDEAKDDLLAERITLAHALEICRLSPEIQESALHACFTAQSEWDEEAGRYVRVPVKDQPPKHIKYLREWLQENVHLNLKRAAFKLDDARLRDDGVTCFDCSQRTGFNTALFADIADGDRCLNPFCFKAKTEKLVQIKKAEIDAKGVDAPLISTYYHLPESKEGIITRYEYEILEKKADRCEYAERAVFADGEEIGRTKWICRETTCKDHKGRIRNSYAVSNLIPSSDKNEDKSEARNLRKQELFDLKADDVVRKRVMIEALKTYSWPLDRALINEIAKELYRRIPSKDQQTIGEVLGWSEKQISNFRFDNNAVLRHLAKLSEDDLARFLMVCSFSHYGSNEYMQRRQDQSEVVKLAKARKVNHTLIDAEVRVELSPKKYRASHQSYCDAIRRGKKAPKPLVYSQEASPAKRTQDEEQAVRETPAEITVNEAMAA